MIEKTQRVYSAEENQFRVLKLLRMFVVRNSFAHDKCIKMLFKLALLTRYNGCLDVVPQRNAAT